MANTVIIKNKSNNTSGSTDPSTSDLTSGELAVNYHEDIRKVYFKDSGNTIRSIPDATRIEEDIVSLAISLG